MENAVEALKMAFGYMMFVLALTISISSFSQARETIDAIITIKDKETNYTYVEPEEKKIVGIETVIPTMYKAYKENFRVVFYKSYTDEANNEPYPLYKSFDRYEVPSPTSGTEINYIDLELEKEDFSGSQAAIEHLNLILNKRPNSMLTTDKNYYKFIYPNGLYNELKDKKFEEILGEYYLEDSQAGHETDAIEANKTKKRVITYILQP